ncbi:large ribosomal subunit protein eL20z-like isoform X2 [Euphorbia lathyris]|uniref:large ribosomal subunit protein eL20z-like isoform X2 n=1 Tax=Euphorbia lathyris TaxID=212925 RepID=UPI00331373E7
MGKTDQDAEGKYIPIRDAEGPRLGLFDKPLPCCGCGFGWFFFLLGFVLPLLWYLGTILYFGKYYDKDPRERSGLAACAIAATFCTVAAVIIVLVLML